MRSETLKGSELESRHLSKALLLRLAEQWRGDTKAQFPGFCAGAHTHTKGISYRSTGVLAGLRAHVTDECQGLVRTLSPKPSRCCRSCSAVGAQVWAAVAYRDHSPPRTASSPTTDVAPLPPPPLPTGSVVCRAAVGGASSCLMDETSPVGAPALGKIRGLELYRCRAHVRHPWITQAETVPTQVVEIQKGDQWA